MQRLDPHSQPRPPAAVAGATHGPVRLILRVEGLVVLAAATSAYAAISGHWLLFALLFLTPDLSMLGYLANRSIGAICYNVAHSYISPAAIAVFGFMAGAPSVYGVASIWIAHIGFDRMLGYGLKYATGFGDTHLGLVGRR